MISHLTLYKMHKSSFIFTAYNNLLVTYLVSVWGTRFEVTLTYFSTHLALINGNIIILMTTILYNFKGINKWLGLPSSAAYYITRIQPKRCFMIFNFYSDLLEN